MEKQTLLGYIVVLIIGLFGKILWDHYISGRVKKKDAYMTDADCKQNQKDCCVNAIKQSLVKDEMKIKEFDVRLTAAEKRLDQGGEDFKAIRQDIGDIKVTMATMAATLKAFVSQFSKNDGVKE